MKTLKLNIKGLHCNSCREIIKDGLKEVGVNKISFNGDLLNVSFNEEKITFNQIKQEIEKLGYKVKKWKK